ncbi:ATP-binding protein [Bradyrhizobium sp. F1.13.3]|uniref:ATP-binding protein n=1 Tax=Bradyrhizobium sp. F1.13.3 TaxID=3156351 RepID=UPI003398C471
MVLFDRLKPRSITTQITGIVFVSVLLGMMLTIAIVIVLFGVKAPKDSPAAVASRISHVTRLIRAAKGPTETDIVLSAARTAGVQVGRIAMSELKSGPRDSNLPAQSWSFMRQLDSEPGIEVLESLRYAPGPEQQLAVKLDDQYALIFDATTETSLWPVFLTQTALILTIVLIFVLLLSMYAVRWIIAPLAAVAQAALSFGRSPQDDQTIKRTGPCEITQVADALNEMRTRIRALLDDRTRMLAAISHDLRTPLTRLRLRAERVMERSLGDAMLSDIANVSRMLDETLDYLREEGKSEAMSRLDLPSLLQTICSEFGDVGHNVSYEGPPRLVWSARSKALTRAVTNIVENGIKHGNTVIVSLRSGPHKGLEIEVGDDGPGIPETLRDRVFEPFFKGDSARTQDGDGFGLGLSIAQDIIKRHGGSIDLLARDPAGLTVRIILPAEISL